MVFGGFSVANASLGSRSNPVSFGEVVEVQFSTWNNKGVFEIELLEIKDGDMALEHLIQANRMNRDPKEGYRYLMAKFRFRLMEANDVYNLSNVSFTVVGSDGRSASPMNTLMIIMDDLISQDLYSGAEHVGWAVVIVEENDQNPWVVFSRQTNQEIWFSLTGDKSNVEAKHRNELAKFTDEEILFEVRRRKLF